MNLSSPLMSLMRMSDASVLSVLARTVAPLTGRQIARLADSKSPGNVRSALLRLEKVGLVIAAPRPDAVLYSANRIHILWPSIEGALDALPKLERFVAAYTKKHGYDHTTVVLFGSAARGESDGDSDVDLLVVHREGRADQLTDSYVDGLRQAVEQMTGNVVQIFEAKPRDLHRMLSDGDPLLDAWLSEGRVLTGPSLERRMSGL